jgi:hypothetical protein
VQCFRVCRCEAVGGGRRRVCIIERNISSILSRFNGDKEDAVDIGKIRRSEEAARGGGRRKEGALLAAVETRKERKNLWSLKVW